jgi:hypothetical protein
LQLKGAYTTILTTFCIAGAGSTLELVSNVHHAIENRRHGFDSRSANKFVVSKLTEIDELLAQRGELVDAHADHPAHANAVLEGKILKEMRNAFVNE